MDNTKIGIIGGSGFKLFDTFEGEYSQRTDTPYGAASSPVTVGQLQGRQVAILLRHGEGHTILPHEINYRANLWSLKAAGVEAILGMATVGGIGRNCQPGSIVIPDQILDYTHSREHTISPLDGKVFHIDFTEPYCSDLREILIRNADRQGIPVVSSGTYAATQGPRFESAAEIRKLEGDGAHIVGMTAMPEVSLAREFGISYATVALVVNYAAGKSGSRIDIEEIKSANRESTRHISELIAATVQDLAGFKSIMPPVITP